MPGANVVVIASVPRKYRLLLTAIAVILLTLGYGIVRRAGHLTQPAALSAKDITASYSIEMVTTYDQRQKGLSGRSSLAPDRAMLFVFDAESRRCIWMKDMQFPIDIVWLNGNKKIVAIERNVSPATYPSSFCHDDSHYVLEFAAGAVDAAGLRIGEHVRL